MFNHKLKKEINHKFREEATLVLAGFHVRALCSLNWNLEMLVFVYGGKPY